MRSCFWSSSRTRAMSEPKIDVAPPAGAVMTVTVPALTFSLFGMVQVLSAFGAGGGSGATCADAIVGSKLAIIPDARRRVIKRIALSLYSLLRLPQRPSDPRRAFETEAGTNCGWGARLANTR